MKALYIHIPFCGQKCFYCSFAVNIGQEKRMEKYIQCLAKEMRILPKEYLDTLYIGGGTPSYLNDSCIKTLFDVIKENYNTDNLKELTFEMNPEDVTPRKVKLLKKKGVNRVSLGVQSANDRYLKYLGRNHNSQRAADSVRILRDGGMENISLDLIYSIPGQTSEEILGDVRKLCALKSDHVSLYSLTIEKNSRFYTKNVLLDPDDVRGRHYSQVCRVLADEGFIQYEISNFSKPGFQSLHNKNYWLGGDYTGIGVSAHSHVDGKRYWNEDRLLKYIQKIDAGRTVVAGEEILNAEQKFVEVLLFGLRMNEGADLTGLEKKFSCCLSVRQREKVQRFVEGGYLCLDGGRLTATDQGRLVLDEISVQLIE